MDVKNRLCQVHSDSGLLDSLRQQDTLNTQKPDSEVIKLNLGDIDFAFTMIVDPKNIKRQGQCVKISANTQLYGCSP